MGPSDLPLYRPLRLAALRDHPAAFGSSFEEEQDSHMSWLIGDPPNITLGGFAEGALIGTAGLVVSPRIKQRHKGHIVGVYVAPRWRRTGLARALMDRLIAAARSNGLIVLTLSVTVGNEAARQLYLKAGFTVYGVEPCSLRVGTDLLDEELMALRVS
ncbi:MAG: GNAT family N-acetyltransferase [Rhodopila sp.]|nr:GNAT family N-acetyltransferase [Rhodopila sp.]